ncbi:F-box protein [Citrus sinensis]|nr:F-box protein [Citrus sinensis]
MEEERVKAAEEEETWSKETVPKVIRIVSTRLSQRDLISLLLVSPWLHRTLVSYPSLWLVIDLREMNNAGNRLVAALSICLGSLQDLESLNLNGCQKISDKGIEIISSTCPELKVFSIYWNVRVTDIGIQHLVKNCKHIIDLNLSGCKNILDKSLQLIADNYQELESLNLTRCVKVTDGGLQKILIKCSSLRSLNLYALSGFTDEAYKKISLLAHLKFLDLCGAQNLSDEGLACIAKCKNLVSLNLTWCVRITDVGVMAIAEGCSSLEFLSLFGIVGVTDKCLEVLSRFCSNTLTTLDVNGCVGIKRSRDELLQLFPHLMCFKVHS